MDGHAAFGGVNVVPKSSGTPLLRCRVAFIFRRNVFDVVVGNRADAVLAALGKDLPLQRILVPLLMRWRCRAAPCGLPPSSPLRAQRRQCSRYFCRSRRKHP